MTAAHSPLPSDHGARWAAWLKSPYLALAGSALFWAGNFIVGRALRDDVPPVTLSFWRWTLALAVLLPLTLGELRRQRAVWRLHGRRLLGLGLTGVAGFQTCVYIALQTTPALNALLFLSLTPAVIVVLSWLFLRERLALRQGAGILVSLLGAALLITQGDLGVLAGMELRRGDLWMMLAVLLWAVYSLLARRRPAQLSQLGFLSATVLAGMTALAPMYLWTFSQGARASWQAGSVAGLVYVALLPSVAAFLFWNRGVQAVGPNRAGMFLHLMPVFGAVLGVLFLGEAVAAYQLVGAGLVLAGIAGMNLALR
jgi:drug/metabolite transporter (DMT)-like permease